MSAHRIMLIGQFRQEELPTLTAVKPGMLVEESSAGNVQAHSVEGGIAERIFVLEDALRGYTTADAYASGDPVSLAVAEPGAVVNALIAVGENIAIGTELVSNGAGALIAKTSVSSVTTVRQVIAVATEALDLSGSGAVATLSPVRLL